MNVYEVTFSAPPFQSRFERLLTAKSFHMAAKGAERLRKIEASAYKVHARRRVRVVVIRELGEVATAS